MVANTVLLIKKGEIMGCDIHMYVEKLQNEEQQDFEDKKPWREIYRPVQRIFSDNISAWDINYYGYENRNYTLFAILAGVRNYKDWEPIHEPKGIPDDCSPFVLSEYKDWDTDGHSHSWFTLQELLDYDWGQISEVKKYCSPFIDTTIERLKELGEVYENIRIVFWFDN